LSCLIGKIITMQLVKIPVSSKLLGSSMIIAPLVFGASTFFWKNGEYGVTGGTILVLSMIFWIPAFMGLFGFLKDKMPAYTSIGFLIATYGCISGVSFGMVGVFSEAFQISHDVYLGEAAKQPLAFNLLLFWSGPLFPLSLLILGINLFRKKVIPTWTAVLICLGAVAFPLSRIPRIEVIAHIADILLAMPLSYIGLQYLLNRQSHIPLE
jgi:hypothetical protein